MEVSSKHPASIPSNCDLGDRSQVPTICRRWLAKMSKGLVKGQVLTKSGKEGTITLRRGLCMGPSSCLLPLTGPRVGRAGLTTLIWVYSYNKP